MPGTSAFSTRMEFSVTTARLYGTVTVTVPTLFVTPSALA